MATATDPAPPPEAADGPQHDLAPGAGVYEYVGAAQRTYLFPGAGPQTAVLGDVCALPSDPGDGNWAAAAKKKVTRPPDPDAAAERDRLEREAHAAGSSVPAAPAPERAAVAGKGGAS